MGCSFKALSDERRRTILAILGEHDASAGEIARRFSIRSLQFQSFEDTQGSRTHHRAEDQTEQDLFPPQARHL